MAAYLRMYSYSYMYSYMPIWICMYVPICVVSYRTILTVSLFGVRGFATGFFQALSLYTSEVRN